MIEEKRYLLVFRVVKVSLAHRDPWAKKETQAGTALTACLGGLVRRENPAFLDWMELLVWMDQGDCLGLENIISNLYH